jgi:60 kDa SS-A/Ro ribonucleoprotein
MARFNATLAPEMAPNLAGGESYVQNPKLELASLLLTSFVKDQFYRTADEQMAQVRLRLSVVDPLFAAKAAIYARDEFGMRSITHVIAPWVAYRATGTEWGKRFFDRIVVRPDDMTEILAIYWSGQNLSLPAAMKKGFAAALGRFDAYQLAKYRQEGKAVSLVDVVNLCHPKATPALSALMKGELKNTDTWEAKLSAAGKDEETKAEAWSELIATRKIGYFALLKNLRNIAEQADILTLAAAGELLYDERLIRKSRVLPFRYATALEAIKGASIDTDAKRYLLGCIGKALDTALANVPDLPGKTLIAVDVSGSMTQTGYHGGESKGALIDQASLFAAALYKKTTADLMLFDSTARFHVLDPGDTTLSLAGQIKSKATSGGTNFHSIFQESHRAYDRIIILSDMQAWIGLGDIRLGGMSYPTYNGSNPKASYRDYVMRTKADPHIYSIDLAGHGTSQFPESRVYALAGFSDKLFDLMKLLEEDRNALVNRIESIEL